MILRRLATNFREQNWFAVAIELVVVIVGVFMGIEVSNWNETRQKHDAAREYVMRIREDLATNIRDLQSRASYYTEVREHGLAALAAFDRPPETLGADFLNDAYQASQIIPRAVGRNTYDEILSVGAVNWIADVDVRKRLANYYLYTQSVDGVMNYVPPYRENLRRHMPYRVQQMITSKCREEVRLDEYGASPAKLADTCRLDLQPEEVAAAVAAIDIPELKLDLTRNLSDIDTKFGVWGRVIERAKALDAELAKRRY